MLLSRELIKRNTPKLVRNLATATLSRLKARPLEDIVLHGYDAILDLDQTPRLSLVIPSISAGKAFGGVTTGVDIFLEIGRRTGADLRIILDDFERGGDTGLLAKRAREMGIDVDSIEIIPRRTQVPAVSIRSKDIFLTYNWWTKLNIRELLREQSVRFSQDSQPHLYLIQEYEPQFYPFSSTHMLARLAFEDKWPYWGIFNSSLLFEYFRNMGHRAGRTYIFEPKISEALRPYLVGPQPVKERRILVYGRPSIQRNCFPAISKGLALWASRYPEHSDWVVVSAGMPHSPIKFAAGRTMRSLGKLSLAEYAETLRSTAIGVSLMSSPHPSYPPLEMAHFGIRTITNRYANKDLGGVHDNIVSIEDIEAETIAQSLDDACRGFEQEPGRGWLGKSHLKSFLEPGSFEMLDLIAQDLTAHWESM
jgi:O-antigen biosynthesis protein